MKKCLLSFITIISLSVFSCSPKLDKEVIREQTKKEIMTMQNQKNEALKAIVKNFHDALSIPLNDQFATTNAQWITADRNSSPTPAVGDGLEGFIKTLYMFHGMILDLKWNVREMLVDDNRVIVKSISSGTPNSPEGHFFDAPIDGSKSFEVQTIDIHTVVNGKMTTTFHLEDWTTSLSNKYRISN